MPDVIVSIDPITDIEVVVLTADAYDPIIGEVVGVRGPQGIQGVKGDKGDPGDPSSAFIYNQVVASSTWIIAHNLGYKPLIDIYSIGGLIVDCSPLHDNDNQITIIFNTPFAGSARLI